MSVNDPLDDDPLVLRPLIADIIRTRYCVPNSLFLVEGIDELRPTRSGRWRAIRLLLGDGELCIQALLTVDMHRFVDAGEVTVGSFLRLHDFGFCKESVAEESEESHPQVQDAAVGNGRGKKGRSRSTMVYLAVEDFTVVGWHAEYARVYSKPNVPKSRAEEQVKPKRTAQRPFVEPPSALQPNATPNLEKSRASAPANNNTIEDLEKYFDTSSSSSDDGFEELPIPDTPPPSRPRQLPTIPSDPVPLARNWTHPLIPLKLTTLSSIPHLPYKQNWSMNIVAVVSSLSPVEPSTFPPYRQRTARLADQSTAKLVHLTVFLDAEEFKPRVGAVVLLAGVKNHLFDGGSLKKYVSDRPREGMPWWVEEPTYPWCRARVKELKEWRKAEESQGEQGPGGV